MGCERPPAILDTAFLFAFLVEGDRDHEAALVVMRDVARGGLGTPIVLDLVVSELFTLLRARRTGRVSEQTAMALLFDPDVGIPHLRLWSLRPGQAQVVAERFRQHEAERLSFVDAAQLVVKDELSEARIVTFDTALRRLGA